MGRILLVTALVAGGLTGCKPRPGSDPDLSTADDAGTVVDSCRLPPVLDFDVVAVGQTATRTVSVFNPGNEGLRLELLPIADGSGGVSPFRFEDADAPGAVIVAVGQTRDITLSFNPVAAGDFAAHFLIQGAPDCPETRIALAGTAVDAVLTWAEPVDFGALNPGASATEELVISNASVEPVTVSSLGISSGDFSLPSLAPVLVPGATFDTNRQRVAGTAALTVRFSPMVKGLRTANVTFATSLAGQPTGTALVRGLGGGPDIEVVSGVNFDLGRVAYQPGLTPPLFAVRKFVVRNAGARPVPANDALNLHFGAAGQPPYWTVTASGSNTQPDELCVGAWDDATSTCLGTLPASLYDPVKGVLAEDPQARVEIPIRVMPKTLGPKRWTVVLASNDRDEPTVTVTITAEAKTYPPCNFQVSKAALNFGLVTPPDQVTLEYSVTNLGTAAGDICLLAALDLPPGTHPGFSLPGGPVVDRELAPGETVRVPVRFLPTGAAPQVMTPVAGTVSMQINNPAAPQLNVVLSAMLGPSCLLISPHDFDFGTVQKDCHSATRIFSVQNVCLSPVRVDGFGFVGTSPDFSTVDTSGIAPNTVVAPSAAPATFSIRYFPTDFGDDSATFVVRATQDSVAVEKVLTLRGTGAATGANTNLFKAALPAVDVVMVVDDSGSMADKQNRLAANSTSLLEYATQNAIDFQIGVTTTDMVDPARKGRIIGGILKSTQPGVAQLLAQRLMVGTSGSITEQSVAPAVAAVTDPLVNTANAGLVRPDASLSFIVFTDAREESPLPISVYITQLQAVKGAMRPDRLTYNVLGPTLPTMPLNCSYDDSSAGLDPKHKQLANALGGVVSEICTADWAAAAKAVGDRAFGKQPTFPLTSLPDSAQPITVKVDGVDVAPTLGGGVTVWDYDPLTNSIEFDPLYRPVTNSTVQVDYQVQCLP